MGRAVFLQHVEHSGPGRLVPLLRDYGIPLEIRKLWRGDEVPSDLDELRVLVVLGGPMSVADASDTTRYPFLAKEVEVLQRLVAADRPALGIALGAQLLAHAAGAKVHPNVKPGPKPEDPTTPQPEFGWGPVTFPFPGGTEPIVYGMVDGTPMFHWHSDTFELPKLPAPLQAPTPPAPPPPTGNALLSSSRLCKNQAFRFKTKLFGFQYHFEWTRDDIEKLIDADRQTAINVLGPDAESKIRQDTDKHINRYARAGEKLVRNFVQYLKAY
jgi:GMP synthase-like glutamine amidotransferase